MTTWRQNQQQNRQPQQQQHHSKYLLIVYLYKLCTISLRHIFCFVSRNKSFFQKCLEGKGDRGREGEKKRDKEKRNKERERKRIAAAHAVPSHHPSEYTTSSWSRRRCLFRSFPRPLLPVGGCGIRSVVLASSAVVLRCWERASSFSYESSKNLDSVVPIQRGQHE